MTDALRQKADVQILSSNISVLKSLLISMTRIVDDLSAQVGAMEESLESKDPF